MSIHPILEIVKHHGMVADWTEANRRAFSELFGGTSRYPKDAQERFSVRAPEIDPDGVPFVAYIHPSNPSSGPYGGMSIAIFPVPDQPALVSFVIGTSGLSPDESIVGRPGHARRLRAITQWLNASHGSGTRIAWAKFEPTRIDEDIPADIRKQFPQYAKVFERYGRVLYAVAVPTTDAATRDALTAYFDLMLEERGFLPLSAHRAESDALKSRWMEHVMPDLTTARVASLLPTRRFVVVQGPPGTGKTRMAQELLNGHYGGRGTSIQFHPNTTYENFVGGLAPQRSGGAMGFEFAPTKGHLMDAAQRAAADPKRRYLLHIDEINRADLSKVLGEAIYLFEPQPERTREVELPYDFDGLPGRKLSLPDNLDILGTMNTADRSIAIVDVAVRRRFAFVDLWPQSSVVNGQGNPFLSGAFDELVSIFVEHAPDEAFNLLPGHSYFLVKSGENPAEQLKVTLLPLLHEYLMQGYVAGFASQIRSYMQRLEASDGQSW